MVIPEGAGQLLAVVGGRGVGSLAIIWLHLRIVFINSSFICFFQVLVVKFSEQWKNDFSNHGNIHGAIYPFVVDEVPESPVVIFKPGLNHVVGFRS